jgi:hypothetical protein
MSLAEKMTFWERHSIAKQSPTSDHCGAEFDDDNLDDPEIAAYCEKISASSAYQWLTENLANEFSHHWNRSEQRVMTRIIRKEILAQLQDGQINVNRAPSNHWVLFKIPQRCFPKGKVFDRVVMGSPLVIYSSEDHIQITTVQQYFDQTWTSGAARLLGVSGERVDSYRGKIPCLNHERPCSYDSSVLSEGRHRNKGH